MSKRKKKHDHEDHIDETWLIPYSDLLTLLLALFIVLFSMSSVDAQKFQILSKAFNDIFTGGTGVTEFQSPMPEGQMESPDERKKDQEKVENQSAQNVDKQELKKIENKITAYVKETHLTNKLNTSLNDEGLLVTIRDNVLFDSGSAEVRPEDVKIAKEIAELLVIDPPRNIIISGHTDNVPIHTANFESNWELSVMRAVNFMKIMLENDKLDPRWISAKGYGEYKPVASNKTEEGRAKNRRVEILILPRTGG